MPVVETQATLSEICKIVRIHVRASGPVSFTSINRYCQEQCIGKVEADAVAAAVNALIVLREIQLYDDGVSFDTTGDRRVLDV